MLYKRAIPRRHGGGTSSSRSGSRAYPCRDQHALCSDARGRRPAPLARFPPARAADQTLDADGLCAPIALEPETRADGGRRGADDYWQAGKSVAGIDRGRARRRDRPPLRGCGPRGARVR
jgi:hypothetical protein